jgi:hypothetical protein
MRGTCMNAAPPCSVGLVHCRSNPVRLRKWHGRGRRFEPDQVHQIFNNLTDPPLRAWPEIGRKSQEPSSVSDFNLSSLLIASTIAFTLSGISCM